MAELRDKMDITVEELEESLGAKKLPEYIKSCEDSFLRRIDSIVEEICKDPSKKAVFVSGPTSSGKTTFTMRLSQCFEKYGRKAAFLSLDDYYSDKETTYDKDGRPDFETIDALDVERAAHDVEAIVSGKKVVPPFFNFMTRKQEERDESEAIDIGDDGILVVEGLHGLSSRINGGVPNEAAVKVFIMPYGNVFCDTKLMDMGEIRLLRRIVRDNRHRGAHAISTVDYWPMIEKSEEMYYKEYLTAADVHVNSFLPYESLIIAPMALEDIKKALKMAEDGTLEANIFMEKSNKNKPFADLSTALKRCDKLLKHLDKIPVINPDHVPAESILNEFISC